MLKRRRRGPSAGFVLMTLVTIAVVIFSCYLVFTAGARQAAKVVETFYTLEQEGKFSSSWELFHSSMHKRFTRETYIQDRSHVFINHFGVDTFTFDLTSPRKISHWQKHEEAVAMDAYKVIATKKYRGKYGYFEFVQHVYVAEEDGEWKVLWDFNEQ
ncbi:hypothetical protein CR205_16055 [Alteribacter lacisalsi]|uniref:DUF4440 domain-containing protein n=1 Tax=Alteribacter lacisalsi TaxID=2045244 RepID=A0A2W0H4D2_9BACI|nr:hypothetical protein [Alteribacter lacisalsi]PYZ95891.1 hypothetical protein CR205_16055 [Alteribacter lacisalsi]